MRTTQLQDSLMHSHFGGAQAVPRMNTIKINEAIYILFDKPISQHLSQYSHREMNESTHLSIHE